MSGTIFTESTRGLTSSEESKSGALRCEEFGDRLADAGTGAGDDRDFSVQHEVQPAACIIVIHILAVTMQLA
jgi:hypothetical protein